uniref:PHD-type domain-containing protein n=1 Tax=Clastoptera arizonana TaxID=38151 RepID=A0A1B6DE55_9HEMI
MMELSKPLQDEIFLIQEELKSAIQNHQILILRQKSNPENADIKPQLEQVQKHIRNLGESQKVLVAKVRSELAAKSLGINNVHHSKANEKSKRKINLNERSNFDHNSRSLLKPKPNNNKEVYSLKTERKDTLNSTHSLLKPSFDRERSLLKKKCVPKENHLPQKLKEQLPIQDSSSEENKTPYSSPRNNGNDSPRRLVINESNPDEESNWDFEEESPIPVKRPKVTLQTAPRPSSPVQPCKILDSDSNGSQDSLDTEFPSKYSDTKEDFLNSLGLVTNEKLIQVQSMKSERRRRRRKSSAQQMYWYTGLCDLTVLQKRKNTKYLSESQPSPPHVDKEDVEDEFKENDSQDSIDSMNNKYRICFICRQKGDTPLVSCNSCPTKFHQNCSTNCAPGLCPTCSHVGGNAEIRTSNSVTSDEVVARYLDNARYTEKLKQKQQLVKQNELLTSEFSELEDKAKSLSVSLVNQVTSVNQLNMLEEKVRNNIKILTDFVTAIQKPEIKPIPSVNIS